MAFTQKTTWNMLYCSNDAVPWLNKVKSRRFHYTVNFKNFKIFEIHRNFICLPAVRPGCARCAAPEISGFQGNDGRLTNVLF